MKLHKGRALTEKQLNNAAKLGITPEEFIRRGENGKKLLAGFIGGVTLVTGGLFVKDKLTEESNNPVCEIQAHSGDSVTALRRSIKEAGDDVRGEKVAVRAPDGHYRSPETDPRYFIDGSMALQAGDTVYIDDVDTKACEIAGGTPLLSLDSTDETEHPGFIINSIEKHDQ